MTGRFTIGILCACLAVLVAGILAITAILDMTGPTPSSPDILDVATQPLEPTAPAEPLMHVTSGPLQLPMTPSMPVPASIEQPSEGLIVHDVDLQSLALAVKLYEPNSGGVSKEVWALETPIAQKMLEGLCDCEQRNWLNHFVLAGQEATSGSADFSATVQLLSQLRRSDEDFTMNQASH